MCEVSNPHTGIGNCRQNIVVVVCFLFAAVLKTGDYWAGGVGGGGGVCMHICIQSRRRTPLRRRNTDTNVAVTEESQDEYRRDGCPRDERTNLGHPD